VWLPEDYSSQKKYAVVYMQDGQMLFDSTTTWNKQELKVDETVSKLIAENKIIDCMRALQN
jgi:predicted alpha/beta superfamily hydrolase